MLPVVPYELEEIKNKLKRKAIEEFGLVDAEFEGSNISQLIDLLAYSTVINNTNLTYGLNEMFITQATDRKNVIKHARQMGYSHKRKLSYQYKIKLRAIKEGTLTLPKYTNFTSNGNNYIYFGEDIKDTYGTNIVIKDLKNEYNNKESKLYSNLLPNTKIISEEGIVCTVLEKSQIGEDRLLIKSDNGDLINAFSDTFTQNIYVEKTDASGNPQALDPNVPYRDFLKIGTVDTFLKDEATQMLKLQITLEDEIEFPIYTKVSFTTKVTSENKLETVTSNPIKFISKLTLTKSNKEDIEVDVNSLKYIKDGKDYYNNVQFPPKAVNTKELHDLSDGLNDGVKNGNALKIVPNHTMIKDELYNIIIDFGNGSTKKMTQDELIIDFTTNEITIPEIDTPKTYYNDNTDGNAINNGVITLDKEIYSVKAITVIDTEGEHLGISNSNYVFKDNKITLKDDDGNTDTSYDDDYSVEIDYVKIEDLSTYPIIIDYSYLIDLTDYTANVIYAYDKKADGYLDRNFFFSDLRGEYVENETPNGPQGWKGFYASDFDSETNVLYFDVSRKNPDDPNDLSFHNEYVQIKDPNTNALKPALPLDKVMLNPFRKTRFFYAEYDEKTGTYIRKGNSCFASVQKLSRKDELELIVKEGNLKRYSDKDGDKILYPELTVKINEAMVSAGYFTVFAPNLEQNGIELFVTRVGPDGTIEYDIPWYQRDYLLAGHTNVNQSPKPVPDDYGLTVDDIDNGITNDEYDAALILWSKQRVQETFIVLSDLNYEDYVNIHTKYAGTGAPLTDDMIVKMNILDSKGAEGFADDLISPVDSDEFEAKYYIDSSFTPYVMHTEGTDIETTKSIREHAPEFSNTANRAVTKLDYKTICEAQSFIASAQVWGGEEMPRLRKPFSNDFTEKILGNIYFSLIPSFKPYTFTKKLTSYTLDNIHKIELFFPTYTQVTGKESYVENENGMKNNKNVLFSILEHYKIITLQLNYEKVIYMDMKINIDVLKYKFGQTVIETNEEIFKSVKSFMLKKIEQFDSTFYMSSLIRHIDNDLGDKYGLQSEIEFSVDLYDSYSSPESGTFKNVTKKSLTVDSLKDHNYDYKGINYPGYDDDWVFEMPIAMPIENLFADDFVTEAGVVERGDINLDNITNIDTDNFINPGDKLYMPLFKKQSDGTLKQDTSTFKCYNKDLINTELKPSRASEIIEIPILYKTGKLNLKDNKNNKYTVPAGTVFKVGTYTISKSENIIILRLNTHAHRHILNPRIYINSNTINPDNNISENIYIDPIYLDEYTDKDGNLATNDADYYRAIEVALPREYFMSTFNTMKLNSKSKNISVTRNVYPRLKSVNFNSK